MHTNKHAQKRRNGKIRGILCHGMNSRRVCEPAHFAFFDERPESAAVQVKMAVKRHKMQFSGSDWTENCILRGDFGGFREDFPFIVPGFIFFLKFFQTFSNFFKFCQKFVEFLFRFHLMLDFLIILTNFVDFFSFFAVLLMFCVNFVRFGRIL